MRSNILNRIPKIDFIMKDRHFQELLRVHSDSMVKAALREALDEVRSEMVGKTEELEGAEIGLEALLSPEHLSSLTLKHILKTKKSGLVRVVNATGIILHTNLGRSLLSLDAAEAVKSAATGFVTLEYDLESGRRGNRESVLKASLQVLTGAEDAVVVNNNAAAVLIVLAALAKGKEVIVSRGELVEIGGSFRIPDVMEMSGARLAEIGTTNRTRISDYRARISDTTGLLLKVHTSNYRILGFHEETGIQELAQLSREQDVPLYVDLGSGALMDTALFTSEHEPTVEENIRMGADIVSFSGDKLLGGPQAGIIVGRSSLIEKIKKHPLMRALRPDKMTIAALEATLRSWRFDQGEGIPVRDMLLTEPERIREACQGLSAQLSSLGFITRVEKTQSMAGGGTLPLSEIPSYGVFIKAHEKEGLSMEDLKGQLRRGEVPIITRIEHDEMVIDLRTVLSGESALILESFRSIAARSGGKIE